MFHNIHRKVKGVNYYEYSDYSSRHTTCLSLKANFNGKNIRKDIIADIY